jgi:transposase-like protein
MKCPGCKRGAVVEIGMNLSQSRITMHACSRCETRWWDRDGEVVGLRNVLSLVPRRHLTD